MALKEYYAIFCAKRGYRPNIYWYNLSFDKQINYIKELDGHLSNSCYVDAYGKLREIKEGLINHSKYSEELRLVFL